MNDAGKLVRSVLVWLVCIGLAVYLMNPGSGQRELLTDDKPFFGNLDEVVATVILISGLRYFGLDIAKFFSKDAGE
ncbi:MAG: DUF1232 domain-containing protein [Planctomycetes bacterium]|nr:DUF1232 domain-containing protein [Planctomycetota bacterium]